MLSERGKIGFVTFIVLVMFSVVIGRLAYLQLYKHEYYEKLSKKQSIEEIRIRSDRAKIFDRNGVVIAKDIKKASVFIYGLNKSEEKNLKRKLRRFGIYKKDIAPGFHWLKRNVDVGEAEKLKRLSDSIDYFVNSKRFYPYLNTFSQILGFTGVDNQGLYGVEGVYERKLTGEEILYSVLKDSRGQLITHQDSMPNIINNNKLVLTVDSGLQKIAESILIEDFEKFKASKAIVAIMDVKSGDILVSVSKPDFDPNRFRSYDKQRWKNPVTHFTFEPGSIFKPVTFAYLLSNKKLNLDKSINCENGAYLVHGHIFNDVHKYKKLKLSEVLIHSSNIGTVKLIDSAKSNDFYRFIKKAGFGQPTGILGSSEETGLLRDPKHWSKLSKYSLSIGQELYVTPIQMLRFYAMIANDGKIITPSYIKSISYQNRLVVPDKKELQVLDKDVAKTLQYLLRKVVTDGTGQNADSDFVSIAGKTGTAQKFDFKIGRYSSRNYVASFAGFFPAENPQYAMIVIYDSPRSSIYGGSTAAVTFRKIAEQMMIYLKRGLQIYRVSDESKRSA